MTYLTLLIRVEPVIIGFAVPYDACEVAAVTISANHEYKLASCKGSPGFIMLITPA